MSNVRPAKPFDAAHERVFNEIFNHELSQCLETFSTCVSRKILKCAAKFKKNTSPAMTNLRLIDIKGIQSTK